MMTDAISAIYIDPNPLFKPMEFNFYDLFKDHSNEALLAITKQPEAFQPAALEAAAQILRERNFVEAIPKATALSNPHNEDGDLLVPFLENVKQKFTAPKWISVLLAFLSAYYGWRLFGLLKHLVYFFSIVGQCAKSNTYSSGKVENYFICGYELFNIGVFFNLFNIVLIFILLYLLYKQNRWGWILVFGENMLSFFPLLIQGYIMFMYSTTYYGHSINDILQLTIKGACCFFMWKPNVASYFGASKKVKTNTVIVVGSILLLSFGIRFFGIL